MNFKHTSVRAMQDFPKVTLIPAPGEPVPENLAQLQKKLEGKPLKSRIPVTGIVIAAVAVGLSLSFSAGLVAGPLDLILGPVLGGGIGALLAAGAVGALKLIAPSLQTLLGEWIKSKAGRGVRIKVGDVELEAHSIKELEVLLEKIPEIQHIRQTEEIPKPKIDAQE